MPLFDIPVVVPYRLRDDRDGVLYSVQVHAIASAESAALAIGTMLVAAHARINHPTRATEVLPDRAKAGQPGQQIDGPYAYVLTQGNRIHHLTFPARIDSKSGESMGNAFAGIDPKTLHAVLMDCHPLTYINTAGLASIAAHAQRLHLRLFRISEPVRKVFEIVGLLQMLRVQPSLQSALDDLVAERATDQG
jgi:anti-anti-sigma regulatory factor